ncbi:phenylacetate--CoA ligase family protein [Pseudomonas fluorescens]|uniref:Phenylacetate--CoA ligase family protein n=2 Tax=Pseudomonas fluorescens TaxID=294 RepID=A0A327N6W2_PSEFL|nr:phenylacetate--CoA ligase family protein [Pseudomonas fluorescens]
MNLFSIKYSLRSFFRDLVRGWWARLVIYPRISRNEFSLMELESYIRPNLNKTKVSIPQAITLQKIESASGTTNKDDIIKNSKSFAQPYSLKTLLRNKISTSGSTGRPLTITQDLGTTVKEEAFVYRQLRWAGYQHGDRRAWLRGDVVCNGKPYRGIYGCRDWWSNTLMLSSYHISSHTAQNYLSALESFNPILIQAYPSSIYSLASWMLANKVCYSGNSLRAIVTSSETLERSVQECIEQAFGCRVFDWYGQAERVAAIGTCEHGGHHVLTDYGRVELLSDSDDLYELVGTSYNNKAMKLSHYRTGDLVRLNSEACPCGRTFPTVDTIIGRRDKKITLADGRQIGRLDHLFKGMKNVVEGQVVYRGENRFILRAVVGPDWRTADAELLVQRLNERVGHVVANVEIVFSIPRGANGKFEFIRIEEDA